MNAFSDPGGIRTHDPQLRRLLLYPAELLDHLSLSDNAQSLFRGAKVMNSFDFAKS